MDESSYIAMMTRPTTNSGEDDDEVVYEFPPFLRTYKSGRVERLVGTKRLPPTQPDPLTTVSSKDVVINSSVSARLYLPRPASKEKLPVLVYYHGGGFVCEQNASPFYHTYLNSLVAEANVVAVSVNYRLAPEHPLPAAYHDSWAALRWVAAKSDPWVAEHADVDRLFVMGDSAGGNICHWLAMKAGEEGEKKLINGMVLVHSYFWGKEPVGSESRDPAYRSALERSWLFVCPEAAGAGADHPWINPLAGSLRRVGCGNVLMCIGGVDIFKERGLAYVDGLRESGWEGKVEVVVSEGEGHVFHLINPGCDKAKEMMVQITSFIGS